MSTRVSDDFNRADSTTLGSNWTVQNGTSTAIQIVSNQAKNANAGTFNARVYSGITWGDSDQWSQSAVALMPSGTSCAVSARASLVSRILYVFTLNTDQLSAAGSSCAIDLERVDASSFNAIASSTAVINIGDILRIEVVGSTIRCKLNGTTVLGPTTDSGIASGNPGFCLVFFACAVDDFTAGNFALSGGAFPIKRPHQIWKAKL